MSRWLNLKQADDTAEEHWNLKYNVTSDDSYQQLVNYPKDNIVYPGKICSSTC